MSDSISDRNFIKNAVEAALRIGIIAALIIWCYTIAAPFVQVILWGIIIAIGASPVYNWLNDKLGGRRGLAATIFSLLMIGALVTPTVYFSEALLASTKTLSANLKNGSLTIPPPPENIAGLPLIGKPLDDGWHRASKDPKAFLGRYEPQVKAVANFFIKTAANIGLGILMFIFALIIAGVFLANAEGGRSASVKVLSRFFGDGKGEELTDLAHQTVQGVVRGILGIAVLQATLAGIGFLAMGIPGAGVLVVVCLILAVAQIDILIILIPLSLYAFSHAGTGAAIAFLIWNLAVGLMNNVLKPILLGRGVKAPMAVVFIGAIGGMLAYGIIGLFVGAVVFVLGYTLFTGWVTEGTPESAKDIE